MHYIVLIDLWLLDKIFEPVAHRWIQLTKRSNFFLALCLMYVSGCWTAFVFVGFMTMFPEFFPMGIFFTMFCVADAILMARIYRKRDEEYESGEIVVRDYERDIKMSFVRLSLIAVLVMLHVSFLTPALYVDPSIEIAIKSQLVCVLLLGGLWLMVLGLYIGACQPIPPDPETIFAPI